jgi:hypothetical protein
MATNKAKINETAFDYTTIKTIEDAFKKCGVDPKIRPDVSMLPAKHGSFLITCFLLTIVFEAINDGWEPDYRNHSQAKYFPWPWVSSSGFAFADSDFSYGHSSACVGFRLCTDSADKARYVLTQFEDLWKEWLLNVKK